MSKRMLVVCLAIVAGLFIASSAMAQEGLPDEAFGILTSLLNNSGNTAGTIVNPEGKGDVLIFPYYDVREVNGKEQDFYFFIINNEPDVCQPDLHFPDEIKGSDECHAGMAAKLRFREADKSLEVFDVDIWLSRGDVWVGAVTHDTTQALPYGAKITSPNYVITAYTGGAFTALGCTGPLGGVFTVQTALAGGLLFPSTAFAGFLKTPYQGEASTTPGYPYPPAIGLVQGNLVGYMEVIGEEATFDHLITPTSGTVQRFGGPGCASTPVNPLCWNTGSFDALNELMGYAYVVRVADGQSQAYNATAIGNFNKQTVCTLFSGPGGQFPTLAQAEDTLDELEFQLGKEEVFSGYDIETAIAAKFSLILTFPTKWFHFCGLPNFTRYQDATFAGGINPCAAITWPLGNPWTVHHANAFETIEVVIFDRHEDRLVPPTTFISPPPPGSTVGLPYELNIVGLYQGTPPTLPAANIRDNLAFSTTGTAYGPLYPSSASATFDSGWIAVEFPNFVPVVPATNPKLKAFLNFGFFYHDWAGLPVLGLALQEFSNSNVGGFYGDIREVFYDTEWSGRNHPFFKVGAP
jgi:hypothetical protein